MSLEFLTAAGDGRAPAESPFLSVTAAAGAMFDVREGWRVPARFTETAAESSTLDETVGWADASHLGKLEVQATAELATVLGGLAFGTATRSDGAWWCLISPTRAIVLCDASRLASIRDGLAAHDDVHVVDVSSQLCALRIAGPESRETIARFCALDLRDDRAPIAAVLPGSVARTPGLVLREDEQQYLLMVGAAYAEYFWSVVDDAGRRLGGAPVGTDAFPTLAEALHEDPAHA